MKFKKKKCPECGKLADGTEDTIPGTAGMFWNKEAKEFEYDGETKVDWDGQETITNAAGEVKLHCPNYHTWFTKRLA